MHSKKYAYFVLLDGAPGLMLLYSLLMPKMQHVLVLYLCHHEKHYNYILEHADKVTYVTNGLYKPSVMQKRNIYMVDKCDRLMAVWNGKKSGGTYNCIEYAKSVNKFIWRIDPSSI